MRITGFIFLLFTHAVSLSQDDPLSLLLDLQYEHAPEQSERYGIRGIDPVYCRYLSHYSAFLNTIIAGDQRSYGDYLAHSEECLNETRSAVADNPEYHNYLIMMYIQSAFVNMNHNDRWRAVRNYYAAWRLAAENEKRHPDHYMNLKSRGILEILAGSVPDRYSWMMEIAGINGDIAAGQARLMEYHGYCSGEERLESVLIIGLGHLFFDPDPRRAYLFLESAGVPERDNFLSRYITALAAMKAGQNDVAVRMLENLLADAEERGFWWTYLLLGEAKLNRLDSDAGHYLELFLDRHPGPNYIKAACHKLSWYYFLNSDQQRYQLMRNRVLTEGQAHVEADRQALHEAEDETVLHPGLLAARLCRDGGYYGRGIEILAGLTPEELASGGHRLERDYRLARLYHGSGEVEKAATHYRKVLTTEGTEADFFLTSSVLQLGLIAEQQKEYELAGQYYRQCLSVQKRQYRESMELQARMGLKRIGVLAR